MVKYPHRGRPGPWYRGSSEPGPDLTGIPTECPTPAVRDGRGSAHV